MAVTSLVASSAGLTKYTQMFTSSGTFTLPSGFGASKPLFARLIVVGGGGGGGGGGGNIQGYTYPGRGGGGGGSGCAFYYENLPIFSSTTTVTIGAGGAGGVGQQYGSGTTGTAGGSTYFGDIEAPGGGGGEGGNAWGGSYGYTSSTTGHSRWLGRYRQTYPSYETERVFVPQRFINSSGQVVPNAYQGCGGAGGSAGSTGDESQSVNYQGLSAGIFGSPGEAALQGYFDYYEYNSGNAHRRWVRNAGGSQALSQGEMKYIWAADTPANTYGVFGAPGWFSASRGRQEGDMWWIPGGGGGGGGGGSTISYISGTAGTRISAGKKGAYGSLNGESAAANTGGGGGGSCGGYPGNIGSGGTGGSGYVLLEYYA